MVHRSRVITTSIDACWSDVYAFARRMENLPRWASGLADSLRRVDGAWVADSPMGRVVVRMVDENPYGVLDHDVTLPDGTVVHNALRVVPNGDGCDVAFTLHQLPGVDDEAFERDAAHVARDLEALRRIFEP